LSTLSVASSVLLCLCCRSISTMRDILSLILPRMRRFEVVENSFGKIGYPS
jgi:hypothetical protein